jgi:hypothetical protein
MTPRALDVLDAWEEVRDAYFFESFAELGPEFVVPARAVRSAALARLSEALHHLDTEAGLIPGIQPDEPPTSPSAPSLRVFYDPLLRRWPK